MRLSGPVGLASVLPCSALSPLWERCKAQHFPLLINAKAQVGAAALRVRRTERLAVDLAAAPCPSFVLDQLKLHGSFSRCLVSASRRSVEQHSGANLSSSLQQGRSLAAAFFCSTQTYMRQSRALGSSGQAGVPRPGHSAFQANLRAVPLALSVSAQSAAVLQPTTPAVGISSPVAR